MLRDFNFIWIRDCIVFKIMINPSSGRRPWQRLTSQPSSFKLNLVTPPTPFVKCPHIPAYCQYNLLVKLNYSFKKTIMKTLSKIPLIFFILVVSTAFINKPGGEGFEISIDNKVVLQRYGDDLSRLATLQLSKESLNSKMTVKYWHCGKIGRNRTITIKDMEGQKLKIYRYPDTNSTLSAMEVPIKDFFTAKSGVSLQISYASSELLEGRTLVQLSPGSATLASK